MEMNAQRWNVAVCDLMYVLIPLICVSYLKMLK